MKKQLLLSAFTILALFNTAFAQHLFKAPDTVCVHQRISLNSYNDSASNYYWGFCSGSISYTPTGVNLGAGFDGFHSPEHMEIIKGTDGMYYGFEVNSSTDEFQRLNFGNSLNNIPTVTNFGNLTHGLPHHPTSLYIYYSPDDSSYFVFVTGGFTQRESTIGRIDFGHSLNNPRPNIANFGNLENTFNFPKGIFIEKDQASKKWFGYFVNRNSSELMRLDFEYNVSLTPKVENLGNPGGFMGKPTDLAAIFDNGHWYLFITNMTVQTVVLYDLGTGLDTVAGGISGASLGHFNYRVADASSISLTRDCGSIYAYITDSTTSQLVSLQMPAAVGPYYPVTYGVIGGMNLPSSVSNIIRDRDDLYAFITNIKDSSLTRMSITQCTNSSIPSFSEVTPPSFSYNDTGWYNIYYVINDGLPTMQVECKPIRVQPNPNLLLTPNLQICKGDSIHLYAISNYSDSIVWSPFYNMDSVYNHSDSIRVWPDYSVTYHVELHYPDGCVVDTSVKVNVIKVIADAGPDRTIGDGAVTTLGGPAMSLASIGTTFTYNWFPTQFNNDYTNPFPTVNPPYDYTYYLKVTDDSTECTAYDTVVVHVNCGDIYLPNAFHPKGTNPATSRFGILNKEINQLNFFRIYDRWGNLVFQTTDVTEAWDGMSGGKDCAVGVYIWEADGFCTSGKHVIKHGNVSLLN